MLDPNIYKDIQESKNATPEEKLMIFNILNAAKEPDEQIFMNNESIDTIEKFFQEHAEDIDMMDYLNNFYFKTGMALTGGGQAEKNFNKRHDKHTLPRNKAHQKTFNMQHSQRYREQSRKEFYDEILSTIEECGINIDKLRDMYKKILKARIEEGSSKQKDFYNTIRKVYIALRRKGYTHIDLRQ